MFSHIARPFRRIQAAFSTAKAEPRSSQTSGEERTRKWLQKLNQLTTSPTGKGYLGQLTTVVNLLNRKAPDVNKDIDWKAWNDKIITQGLVKRVQHNYEELSKQEYEIDRIADNVFKTESKALEQISREMSFHTAVWLDNYGDYVSFLFELEEFSAGTDYITHEYLDFFVGIEQTSEELVETHNYIAGSKDDINLFGYMGAQFAWGKKVVSFYKHPADDFKCGKATKNVMGR